MPTVFVKVCSKCKTEKDIVAYNNGKGRHGKRPECRECQAKVSVLYRAANAEVISSRGKSFRNKNPEYNTAYSKEWVKTHRQNCCEATARWRKANPGAGAVYMANRRKTDPIFRLKQNLRGRLRDALNSSKYKLGSAVKDLGCTVQHLKLHLELFWDEGMSWENYGNKDGQWSIDHIIPLSSFDLSNREQLLQAVHYTNLQPLWHVDNVAKGDKVV